MKLKKGDIATLHFDDLQITATVTSETAQKVHLVDHSTGQAFAMLRSQFMNNLQSLERKDTCKRIWRRRERL